MFLISTLILRSIQSVIGGIRGLESKLGRRTVRRYLLIHQVGESLGKMYMKTMSKVAFKL
jgi:hypothetical protein